ncbi:MAG: flagellar basal body rod protein FlgB [Burkholderiaceae bacterium]|jgi:flagellar basal-body rod protein FlgB
MLNKLTDALDFQGKALKLRAQRQETLTSNIANADTPNYKAVDFDFSKALSAVTVRAQGGRAPLALAATHNGHIGSGSTGQSTSALLQFRQATAPSIDGNTVDIENERSQFAENAVKYEASLRALNGQIKTLQTAMTGSNS